MKIDKIQSNFQKIIPYKAYVNYGYITFNNFSILFGGEIITPIEDSYNTRSDALSSIYIYNISTNIWSESNIKLVDVVWWFGNNLVMDDENEIHFLGGYQDRMWKRVWGHYEISIFKILPHLFGIIMNYWIMMNESNMDMHWNRDISQIIQTYL